LILKPWRWLKAHSRPFLVIALCLLGATLLAYCGTLSSSFRQCSSHRETTYSQKNNLSFLEQTGTVFVCEGVAIDANGGLLTALATIAVAAFTGTLWLVTNHSLQLAREEFNATHRPQLEVHFVREVQNGVEITVINTGTANARFVAARAVTRRLKEFESLPSPHEIPAEGDFNLRNTFVPSASDTYVVTRAGDAFEDGVGGPLHVFGWIVYETTDSRPVRRTTYFGRRSELGPELVSIEGSDWNFIQ